MEKVFLLDYGFFSSSVRESEKMKPRWMLALKAIILFQLSNYRGVKNSIKLQEIKGDF